MIFQTDERVPLKKSKLLEASLSLMIAKGYHGTTVDEICAEAGVTKGSFFHYFKSKEEIGKAAIDFFEQLQRRMLGEARLDSLDDPWKRLQAFLDFFVAMADDDGAPRSCLIAVMTQELADTSAEFRSLCEEKLKNNTLPLKTILDEVANLYPARQPIDTEQLSELFQSIYQGSLILAKARDDRAGLRRNVEHFRRYVAGLFGKSS